ncbi:hypothetical protein [Cupriavidus oxalaticus]|uniref:Uncharacterized protein n=1 Tax=Cupriavidus oxalaticus TaxID=96344 RepID=A0A5P3VMM0_9BURK|nr:hypothetical protein [Cupriavidus oxalaticus]QEZ47188.1 hypothetical protein D2917_23850 [Cupriavidus oxalaticus]
MKIRFIGKDPRAGMIAQMDSRRGQELIDAGCAVQVKENESAVETMAPANADEATAADVVVVTDEPAADPAPPEQPAKGGKKVKGA